MAWKLKALPLPPTFIMTAEATLKTRQDLISAFDGFRSELDDYNDRRDRLIKVILTQICTLRLICIWL